MPRERRTRRTNRTATPNYRQVVVALPSRTLSAVSPKTQATPQVTIPWLFPKLANQTVTPSIPQQELLAQKLRDHIAVALKTNSITGKPARSSYAQFYDLIHRMVKFKTRPSVHDVATEVIGQWFECFASKLVLQLAYQSASASSVTQQQQSLMQARALIEFYEAFFGETIRFLSAAYMSAERRQLQSVSSSGPVLHELCCDQFVDVILTKPAIRQYLTDISVVFFSRARQRLHEEFLCQLKAIPNDWQTFHQQLSTFYQQSFLCNATQAESCALVRSLVSLMINLDKKNLRIFASFLEMPLIKRSVKHAQQLSRDQMRQACARQDFASMTNYLHWVIMYLQMDRFLLVDQFGLPVRAAQNLTQIFSHWMVAVQMDSAIVENGFAKLLKQCKYDQLRLMYEQIQWLYERTQQGALFTALERHIEAQFAQLQAQLCSKYHFKRRTEMLDYVQELLALKAHWDYLLCEVFQTGATRIQQLVFRFFYESLLIHQGVHQALAYYLHHQVHKSSPVPASCEQPPSRRSPKPSDHSRHFTRTLTKLERLHFTEGFNFCSNQMARFTEMYRFLSLIQYIKDVNTFYDYTRHYFCTRLVTSSSAFSPEQELHYLDLLTAEIKRVFVDDPVLVNSTASVSQASLSLVHKHFTQSLNDFKWIKTDWNASDVFFKESSLPTDQLSSPPGSIESFRILHAGIWKLIDYDRCRIPEPIASSFKCIELQHQTKWKNKRLLLNTKYSKAIVNARLWTTQPKPLSLCVSLHQLAILDLFNLETDSPQAPLFTYEQILQGAAFFKESNARQALLSLVYAGLLNAHPVDNVTSCTVLFELNRRFYEANQVTNGTRDLSALEEHNFWCDKSVDMKTADLVRLLGTEEDIQLTSSTASVEDVAQNCSLILRMDTAPTTEAGERASGRIGATNETSEDPPSEASSTASLQGSHQLRANSVIRTTSTGSPVVRHEAIERVIKIEAAIVRVLKRAKRLSSVHEILQHTKQALFSGRAPFDPSEVITFEEVSKALLKLVDKKLIKRNQTGGFEFLVD